MKLSPSLFFHDAIPPSVMVGDMAGILNLVMARDADVALSPSIRASGLIVCREVESGVIHLRGWKRVDLNNGESDMRTGRNGSSVCWGGDGTRWERAEDGRYIRSSFRFAQFPVATSWSRAVLCSPFSTRPGLGFNRPPSPFLVPVYSQCV